MKTIFERYGGFARVSRVVSSFYDSVLRSPILSPYFRSVDMRRLIDHQTKFISFMMGGPASYTNDHLERVHANLGITNQAFSEAVDMLKETMEDHDFEDEDIDEVEGEVLSHKPYIVTKP